MTRRVVLAAALTLAGLGAACTPPGSGTGDRGVPEPGSIAEGWSEAVEWDHDGWWGEWTEPDPAGPEWDDAEWDGWGDGADGEGPIATFTVDGDHLRPHEATPEAAASAAAIWKRFTQLIPADERTMLVGFELLPESYGGAHVYPTDHDPSRWIMGIGLGLGDELDATLIHEFGHLLTLQAGEVPPGSDPRGCTTYFTGEGCALSGSTFAAYVERFWPRSLIDEAAELEQWGDAGEIEAFYQRHRDAFVTDYAATNPAEDLAETFTAFVLGDRSDGTTIADQKVAFLWSDPEMVTLRDRIRAAV